MLAASQGGTDRAIMQAAAHRLLTRLPDLSERLMAEILSGEGQNRPDELRKDLWQVCHEGMGHGLRTIVHPAEGRADLAWARRLGRRRAEQGLPLDQLLRSYRLAGCIFWEGVVEVVNQENPELVAKLVRSVARVWHTIDQQSSTAAEAYHRTEYEMLRRSEERMHAVLDALLEGRGDGGLVSMATTVLGLPAQGRYAVVVHRLGQRAGLRRPALDRWAEVSGMRFMWRMRADTHVALVSLGSAGLDDLVEALRSRVGSHAGVSPVVTSLADLGRARWLAELALRTCRGEAAEIARLDRRLPAALVVSQMDLAGYLSRDLMQALSPVNPAFREILLSTLAAWIDADGSAVRAARRLYCHRNTVLNRLRRLERLTGRSLTRPHDLVELVLAVNALRLGERGDKDGS